MNHLWTVILAAGEGKRMHSSLPKVLHPICGKVMLGYIVDSAVELGSQVLIVIGHQASRIKEAMGNEFYYAVQEKQLGTGHALMTAIKEIPGEGRVLVLSGDTPLLKSSLLKDFIDKTSEYNAALATTVLDNPAGYGRVVRGADKLVHKIVEDSDVTGAEAKINEINTGIYIFNLKLLHKYLPLLTTYNKQGEYYLPDVFSLMHRDGYSLGAYVIENSKVGLGINNRFQLAEATSMIRKDINESLMLQGVTMVDPDNTYIDHGVKIGNDTIIYPNTVIEGNTVIGTDCFIGPTTYITNAIIGNNTIINSSYIADKRIASKTKIGPFDRLE